MNTAADKDLPAILLAYWWSRRWYILKVAAICFLAFCAVALMIPRKFRASATIIILPPRFQSEIRTEPLSVNTAKNLLASGEIILSVIERMRDARKVVETWIAKDGKVDLTTLANLSADEIREHAGVTDEWFAEYLSSLSYNELVALHDFKPAELEDMTVQDLGRALDSEENIEKKTASDIKFSPLLNLYAVADKGPKAQLIVNTWAAVFEKKYDELTSLKTRRQHDSILKQQKRSATDLEDIQTTIVEFKAKHNLDVYLRIIDQYGENFNQFNNQLVLKYNALETARARLVEYANIIGAMENDGSWIGRAVPGTLDPDSTETESLIQRDEIDSEAISDTPILTVPLGEQAAPSDIVHRSHRLGTAMYRRIREKTLQSRFRLEAAMQESNRFYNQMPIELMESERGQVQRDYLDALSRLRTGRVRLEVLRNSLADLDARLSSTQELMTFATSVPDETIGEAVANRRPLRDLASIRFERQEINPTWLTLQADKSRLQHELEAVENEVDQLGLDLPDKEKELKALQNTIYEARLSEMFIKENLSRWQQSNDQLFHSYVETNNNILATAQDITILEAETAKLEQTTSETKVVMEHYQQLYNRGAADLQLLEARQRALQRNADLLLQKLQEAIIAVSEEVSDVSIAAAAVTPSRHFFPPRTILVLALTLLTLGVLLALMGRAKYLEVRSATAPAP